jgi:hypothetical protein
MRMLPQKNSIDLAQKALIRISWHTGGVKQNSLAIF